MSTPTSKSRWSRMGNIVRRTSTVLAISRPTSVNSDRDTDTASLSGSIKGREVPPPVLNPSPIAESPVREAAAVAQETIGPSPLSQPPTSSEAAPPVPVTLLPAVEDTQSPTGYFPPPVLDSTVGNPGAFTDEPDELPQPDIVRDPHVPPVEEVQVPEEPVIDSSVGNHGTEDTQSPTADDLPQPDIARDPYIPPAGEIQVPTEYIPPPVIDSSTGNHGAFTDHPDALPQPEIIQEPHIPEIPTEYVPPPVIDSTVGNHGAFADDPDELPQPDVSRDPYKPHVDTPEPATVVPEGTRQHEPESPSLYESDARNLGLPDHIDGTTGVSEAIPENANVSVPQPDGEAAEYYHDRETVHNVFPGQDLRRVEASASVTTEHGIQEETTKPISMPVPVPSPNSELPSYSMNLGSGQEVWGGEHDYGHEGLHNPYENAYPSSIPVIVPNSEDLKQSPQPSTRMPEADPFADPIAPKITVSHSEVYLPQLEEYHNGPAETHKDIHGPIVMPLPSFHALTSKSIHHAPSNSTLRDGDPIETDETLPLLSRPGTPNKHKPTSYLQSSAHLHSHPHSHNAVTVSPLVFSTSQSTTSNGHANSWNPHPSSHPRLHSLGWIEYHLPDGTVYYVHPTSRVTTEINLRSERMLTGIERFLADNDKNHSESGNAMEGTVAIGGEMWLRDVGTAKSGMVLERWWVDHMVRTVVLVRDEHEHSWKGSRKGKAKKGGAVLVEEDQLDAEYRYWSFMEAHPAHNSLPAKAKMEAMDVLTWAWTERLLPSHRSVPAPFTQEECQELMTLIRSFGIDHQDDRGIQTRIVSRVLLRVAHWRQTYFRPNKPLPANVGSSPSYFPTVPRKPFRRAMVDFLVSCLFLGIPYMFYERARLSSRIDEESGLRNATPTLVIGACTCLVAAIVLSASVTFLSLPGLDSFSRTSSMVGILFATFSMAATVVAIFRHKADLERSISHVGIEGIMVITRRTVILSLPLVFLAYSIIAFITAIVLYSFRGVSLSDPSMTRKTFEDYTKWGVVGVVGMLAGMVTTSALLLR